MKQRATAIAIATVMVVAGLSVAPAATAGSSNCPSSADFEVPEKHSDAKSRDLDPGEEKIGFANVTTDNRRNLTMDLETVGTIGVEVYYLDAQDECTEFNPSDCDQGVSVTVHTDICELAAPEDRTYWVHNTNEGDSQLTFHEFAPVI